MPEKAKRKIPAVAKIREIRTAQGMTRTELAYLSNLTEITIQRTERGMTLPDVTVLSAIADTLGVPIASLIIEADER